MSDPEQTYGVWEVAIALEDCAPLASGHERKLEGDMITYRRPAGGIGTKEAHRYLWLRIEGLSDAEMHRLADPVQVSEDAPIYDKRRYAIPLARLAQIVPTISLARLRDVTDAYQPFCEIDQEARYQFLDAAPPLLAQGLVYDKTTGAYL